MEEILKKLNSEELFDCFQDHGIDEDSVLLLSPDHLREIVPKKLYGARVKFEHNRSLRMKLEKRACNSATEISAISILQESLLFKGINNFYRTNKSLEQRQRKAICGIICDFLVNHKIEWQPKKFDQVAVDIVSLFPTEVKETYYLPIKNKKAGGLLYARYRNTVSKNRSLVEESIIESDDDSNSLAEEDIDSVSYSMIWLQCNSDDTANLAEIYRHWENTFKKRTEQLVSETSLKEILTAWPILKQSFGAELLKLDFADRFPAKENHLFSKFEEFKNKILPIAEKRLKESFSVKILKLIKGAEEGTIDLSVFLLLHGLLTPTGRRSVKCGEAKKRLAKITTADSRKSFFQCFQSFGELNTFIKEKIQTLFEEKLTLQPIICGVGDSEIECKEFFIYFSDIFYEFKDIVSAVDACFKIYNVLDLKYPEESKLVWYFIHKYFFEMDIATEDNISKVISFINDLNK
ncbi:uncharacterized protein [Drosophila takahashii]|uniref:uncharacterized protein isoform X2 n=1 Tax=Drosophila takahashii TaxID=29030 RepID=UPI003898F587